MIGIDDRNDNGAELLSTETLPCDCPKLLFRETLPRGFAGSELPFHEFSFLVFFLC